MQIELKKFGDILISRPSGREAALVTRAYLIPKNCNETIEINFSGVAVMTPSWLDEFVSTLKETSLTITFQKSENPTVIESINSLSA